MQKVSKVMLWFLVIALHLNVLYQFMKFQQNPLIVLELCPGQEKLINGNN